MREGSRIGDDQVGDVEQPQLVCGPLGAVGEFAKRQRRRVAGDAGAVGNRIAVLRTDAERESS
jgi:hypothetical protein